MTDPLARTDGDSRAARPIERRSRADGSTRDGTAGRTDHGPAHHDVAVEGEPTSVFLSAVYRLPMWVVLAVMASADAYVFWNTLAGIMQRQVAMLWVFVLALSLGSVAACHYVGRLLRIRADVTPGRIVLVVALLLGWLVLGLTIAWIRTHDEIYAPEPEEIGVIGTPETDSAAQAGVFVAALMFVLYLLTGLLTIAHSLHYIDPVARRAQLRGLHRRHSRRLARLRHEAALAQNLAEQHEEDIEREQAYFDARNERHDAWTHLLAQLARVRLAVHLGDPAATDGLAPPSRVDPGPGWNGGAPGPHVPDPPDLDHGPGAPPAAAPAAPMGASTAGTGGSATTGRTRGASPPGGVPAAPVASPVLDPDRPTRVRGSSAQPPPTGPLPPDPDRPTRTREASAGQTPATT